MERGAEGLALHRHLLLLALLQVGCRARFLTDSTLLKDDVLEHVNILDIIARLLFAHIHRLLLMLSHLLVLVLLLCHLEEHEVLLRCLHVLHVNGGVAEVFAVIVGFGTRFDTAMQVLVAQAFGLRLSVNVFVFVVTNFVVVWY